MKTKPKLYQYHAISHMNFGSRSPLVFLSPSTYSERECCHFRTSGRCFLSPNQQRTEGNKYHLASSCLNVSPHCWRNRHWHLADNKNK